MKIRIILWTSKRPPGDQEMPDGWYISEIFEFEDTRTKDGKFTAWAQKAFDQALEWSLEDQQKSSMMMLYDEGSEIAK